MKGIEFLLKLSLTVVLIMGLIGLPGALIGSLLPESYFFLPGWIITSVLFGAMIVSDIEDKDLW